MQFSEGKDPKPGDKIVYTAGAFDLFRILESVRKFLACPVTPADNRLVKVRVDLRQVTLTVVSFRHEYEV